MTTKPRTPVAPTTEFQTITPTRLEGVTGGSRTHKDSPDAKDARADQYLS